MTESNPEKRYCQAIKRNGEPCKAWGSRTTGLCPCHSPNFREIAAKGGKSKSKQAQLMSRLSPTHKDLLDALTKCLGEVHQGTVSAQVGQSLAALSTAILKIVAEGEKPLQPEEREALVTVVFNQIAWRTLTLFEQVNTLPTEPLRLEEFCLRFDVIADELLPKLMGGKPSVLAELQREEAAAVERQKRVNAERAERWAREGA